MPAVEPERERRVEALRRVGTAERWFEEQLRSLEGAQGFAPDLQHHRVAHARTDGRFVRGRGLYRRSEIGGAMPDRRIAFEPDEQAVGPEAPRTDRERNFTTGREARCLDFEAAPFCRRHRSETGTEGVASSRVLPGRVDQCLCVAVRIQEDASLLVQDTREAFS